MNAIQMTADTAKKTRWKSALAAIQKIAWVVFLISLPVTSFPFFPPAMGGGALVRPLALYPLILLFFLVTIPHLLTKPLPKTLLSFLPFVLVALGSSLFSLLRGIEPALGIQVEERVLRALITLGVGGAIYLTVAIIPRTLADLRFALRWMYVGFAIALIWASLQATYVIHFTQEWFQKINSLQQFVSVRRLFTNRVSGMTYEPNWFAEQLTFLLLPWLIASVLSRYTVFRRWRLQRWRWITIELLLLLWSIAILPFTFSRAGVMNLVALAFVSILFFRFRTDEKAETGKPAPAKAGQPTRRLVMRLVEATVVLAVIVGLVFVAGKKNEFFARLWGYWEQKNNRTLVGYFKYLGFGARFIYGETALRIYDAYPAFGVGLGNYAFYFDEMLPDRPLAYTPEVLRLVTPEEGRNRLITSKNFYFRILAETGLAGMAAFLAFFIAILGSAIYLWLSPFIKQKFWGTAALLGLIAFILSALSFDSFAVPNMWVVFGLITSAAWVFSHAPQVEPVSQEAGSEFGENLSTSDAF